MYDLIYFIPYLIIKMEFNSTILFEMLEILFKVYEPNLVFNPRLSHTVIFGGVNLSAG